MDFFLISASLKYKIKDYSYDAILILDHAPISIVYQDFQLERDPPRWRFKQKWLTDPGFVTFLDEKIIFYFETNTTDTARIRWEAFTAFIRDQIIQITSSEAGKTYQETNMLETEIKVLEKDYYQSRSGEKNLKKWLLLRTKYNEISASKAIANLHSVSKLMYFG